IGVSPCLRSSRAISFSLSPARLPVRTLPSLATARKKKVAAITAPRKSWRQKWWLPRGDAETQRKTQRTHLVWFSLRLSLRLCVSAGNTHFRSASEFLRHPHHFFHRGHAVLDLAPAVFAQIAHAVLARRAGQDAGIRVLHNQLAHLIGDVHHLEDADARTVAAPTAFGATGAAPGKHAFAFRRSEERRVGKE